MAALRRSTSDVSLMPHDTVWRSSSHTSARYAEDYNNSPGRFQFQSTLKVLLMLVLFDCQIHTTRTVLEIILESLWLM